MAQEWYLLKHPYHTSGDEELDTDALDEMLDSELAETVELYNYDLTERQDIRAIIDDKVTDTKLKTLNRQILTKIGTIHAGEYIKYKGRYWLIVGIVDDNHFYEKGIMTVCNHLLTWINPEGKIIQRWANVSSASQYNNGETSTMYFYVRTDQLLVLTPPDEESMLLTSGQRFVIDSRCKIYEKRFDETVTVDCSNPVVTYELTRADSVLYDYQDSGHFEFLCTQDEQHKDDGYYVVNGKGYWLCGSNAKAKAEGKVSTIEADSVFVYNAAGPSEFVAVFTDDNGNPAKVEPQWEIKCDFADSVISEIHDNAIYLSVNNSKLIGKKIELVLNGDGYEPVSINIPIQAFI